MRVGSFRGKGVVYNKKGRPILQNGEKIVKKINEKCCVFYTKKRGFIGQTVLSYSLGVIYLTNRRFVFLRTPLSFKESTTVSGITPDAVTHYLTARDMKKQGVMEFIEFKYEEIGELKRRLFGGEINFFAEERVFSVGTKKYVLNEIKKIMKKTKGE